MDIFILSKRRHICYNSSVPQKRDESIFDIGGRQIAPAVGPKPGSCVPHDRIGRAACSHAAASTAEGKTLGGCVSSRAAAVAPRPPTSPTVGARVPRARLPKELRKRIRRPQCIRNSVLGFVAKPLTFPNEKPNTMVRRVVSRGVPSFLVFRQGS